MSRDYSRLDRTLFRRESVSGLTAIVIGAGALGNEVIKNLTLLGIGRLIIVDRDHIEPSNLTRSVLYCTPEIDRHLVARTPKAVLAAERVSQMNSDVQVEALVSEVADVGLGVLRRADVVLGCLDSEPARFELSWQCVRADRPLVDGGLAVDDSSSGAVLVFPGAHGPCFLCRVDAARRRALLWELQGSEDPCWLRERRLETEGFVSTTPVMASIVGALQVEMAVHAVAAGLESRETGSAHVVRLTPRLEVENRTFRQGTECPLHESAVTDVVARADRRSDEWTVREMLSETAGPAATATLCLDWPMTAAARCDSCGSTWEPWLRRARFRRSMCPRCGAGSPVECEVVGEITAGSIWAGRSLADIGLPRSHIHEVVTEGAAGRARVFVEIAGDRPHAVEKVAHS